MSASSTTRAKAACITAEDGNDLLPAVQFATLAGHPTGLLATDFLVFGGSMGGIAG